MRRRMRTLTKLHFQNQILILGALERLLDLANNPNNWDHDLESLANRVEAQKYKTENTIEE